MHLLQANLESSQTGGATEEIFQPGSGVCNMDCEYESEELIPGLPNEVSIEHIASKVPWGKLFSLNRSWRRAITSGQVHEARVRTNSTQLLVAMIHYNPASVQIRFTNFENFEDPLVLDQVISLYSPSANTWHQLPLISGVETGIPHLCECVFLHGRLYIIGGCDEANGVISSKEVYSINLWGGKSKWIRCADMLQPREGFSSGVMNGKIYVFGGTASDSDEAADTLPQAEVFDPVQNVWSPLAPMLHSSAGDSPIIEEAFTLDGFFLVRCGFRNPQITQKFVEIYNPEKDQWWKLERDINTFGPGTFMMTVAGNFYFFEHNNVVLYDFRTRCPTAQPNSLKVINETRELDSGHVFSAAPAGGGEVLALHYWSPSPRTGRTILLKSKGLGKPKCSLQWENLQCEYEFDSRYTRMCVVEI
ncbi:unnamed protein product [Calypogeia fissa]